MASRPKQPDPRPAPRLYLVTPAWARAGDQPGRLADALATADIAAVLLRLSGDHDQSLSELVKDVATVVQASGAALIVEGHAQLAVQSGADGAHATGVDAFRDAAQLLKPDRISGAGGLVSRHDAMVAAEAGADYVMFGETFAGNDVSLGAVEDRVAWWAEVFETPCVAFAPDADAIAPLVRAGADFIAVEYVWTDPRGLTAALADAMSRLAMPESVA